MISLLPGVTLPDQYGNTDDTLSRTRRKRIGFALRTISSIGFTLRTASDAQVVAPAGEKCA